MTTGPEEAYRYAMGEPVKHPAGYEVQFSRPLDFQGMVADALELRDFQQTLAPRF